MKFVHIFETRKRRTRGITIAYESVQRQPHELPGPAFYDVTCGVAYCAPVERNYSRSLGRKISSNRLACDKPLVPTFRFQMLVSEDDLKGVGLEYLVVCGLAGKLNSVVELDWASALIKRRIDGYLKAIEEQAFDERKEDAKFRVVDVTEQENGQTVTVNVDDVVMVNLHGNATTGFDWHAGSFSKSLPLVNSEYIPDQPMLPGRGGTYRFCFRPDSLSAGYTHMADFSYRRPWESPDNALRRFSIGITVLKVEHEHHKA